MTQERQAAKAAASPETFKEKLARLSESEREVVRRVVDQFLEGAS
jgi:FixJ family two-component response regulator